MSHSLANGSSTQLLLAHRESRESNINTLAIAHQNFKNYIETISEKAKTIENTIMMARTCEKSSQEWYYVDLKAKIENKIIIGSLSVLPLIPTPKDKTQAVIVKAKAAEYTKKAHRAAYVSVEHVQQIRRRLNKTEVAILKTGSSKDVAVVLENYATPEELMHGTGELRMIAIDVGFADAIDTIVHIPWELKLPIFLSEDREIILYRNATICNIGAEVSDNTTTTLFPFTPRMHPYLISIPSDVDAKCDQVIEITLSELEHHIHGPFTSHLSRSLSKFNSII
ncbi:hypothetical protein Glove_59g30 [Diversispora epigaea]|uniref:Uncharacterized protein n=1 Tax=Diversispora epigaea TaxID=1348612 RepID=A0A397JL21_9GLOM|nr:hypothetical protein Glove_59g30 [Diversispora epigaea]